MRSVTHMSTNEEPTTTTPNTIGSINGPADVGAGEPTTTALHCYDVSFNGNSPFAPGIGQDDNFQPCQLPVVEVGTPPVLPDTGAEGGMLGVGLGCLIIGALFVKAARRTHKLA